MEEVGPLGDDARPHPLPGPDVELSPGVKEASLVRALDHEGPLVLRAEGEGPPAQRDLQSEGRTSLIPQQTAHQRSQTELDRVSEGEIPADPGRSGPDGLVVVAKLEVEWPVVRRSVEHPEVLLVRYEVPGQRGGEAPGAQALLESGGR